MGDCSTISKLVRSVLFGTEEDVPAGVNWRKVFDDSITNRVSTICLAGVMRLPEEERPGPALLNEWEQHVSKLKDDYNYRHEATLELKTLLEENGIRMLLLEGETLAENYPIQYFRECNVVKFILPIYSNKLVMILRSNGVAVRYRSGLISFEFKGVRFECLMLRRSSGFGHYHPQVIPLMKLGLFNTKERPDGCLDYDPETKALYAVECASDIIRKSGGRMNMRILVDLAMLLRRYPYILLTWEGQLRKTGLDRFADTMLCSMDQLLHTGIKDNWSFLTRVRAKKFTRLLLSDSKT